MSETKTVGLIGDYDATVPAHQAIPIALRLAIAAAAVEVEWQWVPTDQVSSVSQVSAFDGIWCVPASPYRNMEGALLAIQYARESGCPFLGTCGGFQHAVVEYARNVLEWTDAAHAELEPEAARRVITPLACDLVEKTGFVHFVPGSRIARAYGTESAMEGYHCRYGVNPEFWEIIASGPLRATASDAAGDVRGVELDDHPFFVGTLFQPERLALKGQVPPLVAAFVRVVSPAA
jgi:CTP synthase (UTP-ammonia lyase)